MGRRITESQSTDAESRSNAYRIESWLYRPELFQLEREAERIKLEPRVAKLLLQLIESGGSPVTREELMELVWPGMVVGDEALSNAVNKLRKAFGDDRQNPRIIETIPKVGYRLIAEVGKSEIEPTPRFPEKPSIAVLPFTNMSGDPEQDYFSDGITDDIITGLSRSPWLFVIARNSSFVYRGKSMDVRSIARELGVRYILEGSVRNSGQRIRVTAQLIDGVSGSHVWAEKYDGQLEDVFDLQDEITRNVVASAQTEIHLSGGAVHMTDRKERPNMQVWELVARAWSALYGLNRESLLEAERFALQAIDMAPASCEAHLLYAGARLHLVWMGFAENAEDMLESGYEAAKRAVELDERNEYAHWICSLALLNKRDFEGALYEVNRSIELNPNCSLAHGTRGTVLCYSGHPEESIRSNEIAIRSNPKDVSLFFRFTGIAIAHLVSQRFEEASEWAAKAVQMKPGWDFGHIVLISSLFHLGKRDEALEASGRFLQTFPNATISSVERLPFKDDGDREMLRQGLRGAGIPE